MSLRPSGAVCALPGSCTASRLEQPKGGGGPQRAHPEPGETVAPETREGLECPWSRTAWTI